MDMEFTLLYMANMKAIGKWERGLEREFIQLMMAKNMMVIGRMIIRMARG
jgi:hypothetical protein